MTDRERSYRLPLPGGRVLELGERTVVMGILNITPDSFSDGGVHLDRRSRRGRRVADGGRGRRHPRYRRRIDPSGAESVGADEELRRVLPVIERLAALTPALLSIDTYKAIVGREAVARGASIINDISGLLYDPELGRCGRRDRDRIDPDAHARALTRDVRACGL